MSSFRFSSEKWSVIILDSVVILINFIHTCLQMQKKTFTSK